MPFPDFFGQDVDEADALINRALVEGVGRQIPVKVSGAQVRDHLGRRHNADLDIDIRVQTEFGNVVAQQEVVHRILERHAKGHAFPHFRVALVQMFVRQHDRLTVDVFHRRHDVGFGHRPGPQRHRQWHRRQHVAGVVFPRQRLVARHGPARRLNDRGIQSIAAVKAQRFRHDDRCGAGDRHKANVQISLFRRAQIIHNGGLRLVQRKHRRQRRSHRRSAHHAHERPPPNIALAKNRADDRAFDSAFHDTFGRRQVDPVVARNGSGNATAAAAIGPVPQIGLGRKRVSEAFESHLSLHC